jgi:hypothetical protein
MFGRIVLVVEHPPAVIESLLFNKKYVYNEFDGTYSVQTVTNSEVENEPDSDISTVRTCDEGV